MRVKTNIKAGGLRPNHNESLVRDGRLAKSLKVKTELKAGLIETNHNESLVRASRRTKTVKSR